MPLHTAHSDEGHCYLHHLRTIIIAAQHSRRGHHIFSLWFLLSSSILALPFFLT